MSRMGMDEIVLADITAMLRKVLSDYGLDDIEITRDSGFHSDLEMESIDLVALAGELEARYGDRVNFAEFVADLELEEIIGLRVGQLADYIVAALQQPAAGVKLG
jgi:acyl carrier protein